MANLCQPSTCSEVRPSSIAPREGRCRGAVARGEAAPLPPSGPLASAEFRALCEAPAQPFKVHRTGDVARVAAADAPFGVAAIRKRFWYPRPGDRWRGVLRTTLFATSRVAGEAESLERLARLGLQPRLALAWGEARRGPFLVDSFLYLREVDALPLDAWLGAPREPAARIHALAALARFVAALHRAGIVDRDLHLRNVLRRPDGALLKIDSPFARRVRAPWRRIAQARERAALAAEVAARVPPDEAQRFADELRVQLASP